LVLPWLALQEKEARHADHNHAQERDRYAASGKSSGQHCEADQEKQNSDCLSCIRSHHTPPKDLICRQQPGCWLLYGPDILPGLLTINRKNGNNYTSGIGQNEHTSPSGTESSGRNGIRLASAIRPRVLHAFNSERVSKRSFGLFDCVAAIAARVYRKCDLCVLPADTGLTAGRDFRIGKV
jgi:hypothetical protein